VDLQERVWERVYWINMAALVNTAVTLQVPQNAGNFLTTENILASQKGLCSMESFGENVTRFAMLITWK
jgi:hypothetical protein